MHTVGKLSFASCLCFPLLIACLFPSYPVAASPDSNAPISNRVIVRHPAQLDGEDSDSALNRRQDALDLSMVTDDVQEEQSTHLEKTLDVLDSPISEKTPTPDSPIPNVETRIQTTPSPVVVAEKPTSPTSPTPSAPVTLTLVNPTPTFVPTAAVMADPSATPRLRRSKKRAKTAKTMVASPQVEGPALQQSPTVTSLVQATPVEGSVVRPPVSAPVDITSSSKKSVSSPVLTSEPHLQPPLPTWLASLNNSSPTATLSLSWPPFEPTPASSTDANTDFIVQPPTASAQVSATAQEIGGGRPVSVGFVVLYSFLGLGGLTLILVAFGCGFCLWRRRRGHRSGFQSDGGADEHPLPMGYARSDCVSPTPTENSFNYRYSSNSNSTWSAFQQMQQQYPPNPADNIFRQHPTVQNVDANKLTSSPLARGVETATNARMEHPLYAAPMCVAPEKTDSQSTLVPGNAWSHEEPKIGVDSLKQPNHVKAENARSPDPQGNAFKAQTANSIVVQTTQMRPLSLSRNSGAFSNALNRDSPQPFVNIPRVKVSGPVELALPITIKHYSVASEIGSQKGLDSSTASSRRRDSSLIDAYIQTSRLSIWSYPGQDKATAASSILDRYDDDERSTSTRGGWGGNHDDGSQSTKEVPSSEHPRMSMLWPPTTLLQHASRLAPWSPQNRGGSGAHSSRSSKVHWSDLQAGGALAKPFYSVSTDAIDEQSPTSPTDQSNLFDLNEFDEQKPSGQWSSLWRKMRGN